MHRARDVLSIASLTAGLAALFFAAVTPIFAQASTIVAESKKEPSLAAYDGRLIWSQYDPSTRRYQLMSLFKGNTQQISATASKSSFQSIDLGPDPGGSHVAVYSRCTSSGNCDIYRYRFKKNKQQKIKRLATREYNEYYPTVWRDQVAFSRVWRKRKGHRYRNYLYRNGKLMKIGKMSKPRSKDDRPVGMDLRSGKLAYIWASYFEKSTYYRVRLLTLRSGKGRVIGKAHSSPMQAEVYASPISFTDKNTILWTGHESFYGKAFEYSLKGKKMRSGRPKSDCLHEVFEKENTWEFGVVGDGTNNFIEYECTPASENYKSVGYRVEQVAIEWK